MISSTRYGDNMYDDINWSTALYQYIICRWE